MAFVLGPRQVGKTTTCLALADCYLDWDHVQHQRLVLDGPDSVAQFAALDELRSEPVTIAFDELHKFSRWKQFIKGLFDTYSDRSRSIVTGSSRLDVFRRGGDSLMGRYFIYRMHPFSLAELISTEVSESLTRSPKPIGDEEWQALVQLGGYPEPLLRADQRFSRRWNRLRHEQLFKEDVRDLTRVQELSQLEALGTLLASRSGEQLIMANLAQEVRVAPNTLKAWIEILCSLHFGFLVRPWFRNVAKALRKEPKWFLRDWSGVVDPGKRAETLVACHLLKAVEYWTDRGVGDFELRYLRDKLKREVDFIVIRDGEPWFLVEVKSADDRMSEHLAYFQDATGARHAFQVALESPYVEADCFARTDCVKVPARTFLSQLV